MLESPRRSDPAQGLYHVFPRGRGGNTVFFDDLDRSMFLGLLECTVYRFRWILCAYCLMGTHYHLLVDTSRQTLSSGVRSLHATYSRRFNQRHEHPGGGRLFPDRLFPARVDEEYRMMNAVKYMALNPVEARLCNHPGEWAWSSYSAIAGILAPPPFLSVQPVLDRFSHDTRRARNLFIDFIDGSSPEVESDVKARYYLQEPVRTIKARRRMRPALSEIFEDCDSRESRDHAIGQAYNRFGYTLDEIGEHLGLHVSTVCKIAKKYRRFE
ncbi:MAG: transposase [Actinobacteria bacterium]|nr:transposase [Actinomycetota bacterium]MBU1943870.1 transposase [Actinomycetota bacterium]MBU2688608.1 transposase [Actinomycetota bacterium]